ncbi:HpcH/HpaI aldolase/citrate lyase family protein [Candidatus Omnitrophota bacterium]
MDLKQELAKKKVTIGSWITIGDTSVAEIMARSGFDWLTIDMEHSAITLPQAQEIIRVIELCGVVPLVRVGANDPDLIKRVMDAGAFGVIVPMVNSGEDAQKAVAAAYYPPRGKRGVGLARAQSYGFGFEDYKKRNAKKSVVIAQIEHKDAIENLEDILTTKGIDGTIIGPYDLSASLGYPGQFARPAVKKALKKYESICVKLNKPMGSHVIPPDVSEVRRKKRKGYKFIAWSLDTLFLGTACREGLKVIKKK